MLDMTNPPVRNVGVLRRGLCDKLSDSIEACRSLCRRRQNMHGHTVVHVRGDTELDVHQMLASSPTDVPQVPSTPRPLQVFAERRGRIVSHNTPDRIVQVDSPSHHPVHRSPEIVIVPRTVVPMGPGVPVELTPPTVVRNFSRDIIPPIPQYMIPVNAQPWKAFSDMRPSPYDG